MLDCHSKCQERSGGARLECVQRFARLTVEEASNGTAITLQEARAALAALLREEAVLLAVSGGPDSIALLHLAADVWSEAGRDNDLLQVATVDHGLRPESAGEARIVQSEARSRGLRHHTLTWGDPTPNRLQENAREARYRLLGDLARRIWPSQPSALATAHTRNDQIETFVMRLARGSGIEGLAAMRECRWLDPYHETRLLRPFLGITKSRLAATLRSRDIAWVEDSSNVDRRFERIRVREALAAMRAADGASESQFAESIRRLQLVRGAIEQNVRELARAAGLEFWPGLRARFSVRPFGTAPRAVQALFLQRLITALGGQRHGPRLSKLEPCLEQLTMPTFQSATLGGTLLKRSNDAIIVLREFGRVAMSEATIQPGESGEWDGRFLVSVPAEAPRVTIRPLAAVRARAPQDEVAVVKQMAGRDWPVIRETYPAAVTDAGDIALPILRAAGSRQEEIAVNTEASVNMISRRIDLGCDQAIQSSITPRDEC